MTGGLFTQKKFWHFFWCGFTIAKGDGLVSGFDDKYNVVYLSFSGSQAKSNWVSQVY